MVKHSIPSRFTLQKPKLKVVVCGGVRGGGEGVDFTESELSGNWPGGKVVFSIDKL